MYKETRFQVIVQGREMCFTGKVSYLINPVTTWRQLSLYWRLLIKDYYRKIRSSIDVFERSRSRILPMRYGIKILALMSKTAVLQIFIYIDTNAFFHC